MSRCRMDRSVRDKKKVNINHHLARSQAFHLTFPGCTNVISNTMENSFLAKYDEMFA
jgi:hypothetical protein